MRGSRARLAIDAPNIYKTERTGRVIVLMLVMGLISGAIGYWAGTTLDEATTPEDRREQFIVASIGIFFAALFLGAIPGIIWAQRRRWAKRRAAEKNIVDHGWHYHLELPRQNYTATLFGTGGFAWIENSAHLHDPRYLEVANYSFVDEQQRRRREVGFVEVGLDRRLPHMYLESTVRGDARAYVPPFKTAQRLSLEGDFDRHFTLYCPKEYERDALYVITPDVMALMIDEAPGFDIEIVDERLYVIARKPFGMTSNGPLEFALRVAETLGSTTARQSRHYRDDRSAHADFVDESGARLRTGRWLITLLPAALAGAVWVGIAWANGLLPW